MLKNDLPAQQTPFHCVRHALPYCRIRSLSISAAFFQVNALFYASSN